MTSLPILPRLAFAAESAPTAWYWKDCTEANLIRAVNKVKSRLQGKTAIKVHTGEPHDPNIIPPQWVEALADFIRAVGLPTTLQQLGVKDMAEVDRIAQSVQTGPGSCRKCTAADVEAIFKTCWA